MNRRIIIEILLCVFAAATTAYDYSFLIADDIKESRMFTHREIVTDTGGEQKQYRVLVPFTLDPLINLTARWIPYDKAFGRVYALYHLVALSLMFFTLARYLAIWFSQGQALAGTFLAATAIRIALRHHYYQPWSLLEPSFIAMALICTRREWHVALGMLVAVASFNRETAVFLPIVFALTAERTPAMLRRAAIYFAIWIAIAGSLRVVIHSTPRYLTLWQHFQENVKPEQLAITATNLTLFLGPLWIFAALGYRYAPPFVRRAAWVFPLYLVSYLLFGLWWEVRLLMTMYPILMPLAMAYVFRDADGSTFVATAGTSSKRTWNAPPA